MLLIVKDEPLPYVDRLPERDADAVTLVVIHCTELPDLAMAREYGERAQHPSGVGHSGHYYIDRDGCTLRYVPGTRVANHVRGHNAQSIGIELVNLGRYPHWWDSRHQTMTQAYPEPQLVALEGLLDHLREAFPRLTQLAGHQQLDTGDMPASDDPLRRVQRKLDPGPMFPWPRVLRSSGLTRPADSAPL